MLIALYNCSPHLLTLRVIRARFRFPLTRNIEGKFLPATLKLKVYDKGWAIPGGSGDTVIGEKTIDLNQWYKKYSDASVPAATWLNLLVDETISPPKLAGEVNYSVQYVSPTNGDPLVATYPNAHI